MLLCIDGRKIPPMYENPIDNILIDTSNYLGKIFRKFPFFTPNIFTTISLIISLVGIYYIYNKCYKIGSILLFVGYFFDVLDGNFARTYNMETDFGDKYDHISDICKVVLLIYVILFSTLKKNIKILFIIVECFSLFFALVHLGCQEKYYSEKSVLDHLKLLCYNKKYIFWTKYFGCGTQALIITLFIYNITHINKLM